MGRQAPGKQMLCHALSDRVTAWQTSFDSSHSDVLISLAVRPSVVHSCMHALRLCKIYKRAAQLLFRKIPYFCQLGWQAAHVINVLSVHRNSVGAM